ncbi:MAG: 2-oxo acid dehydrogenase subunit E2 [Deinococcales bacterium]
MAEFKIPVVGEGIESGTVVSILVKVGDKVTKDQGLLELETDKAVVEVPSDAEGTVEAIHIKEGQEVQIGQAVMVIGAGSASPSASAPAAKAQESSTPVASSEHSSEQDVILPEVGEGITSGMVVAVLVKVGDQVAKDQGLLELETDKAVVEVPAPQAGVISAVLVKEGQEAKIGQAVVKMQAAGGAAKAASPSLNPPASAPSPAPMTKELVTVGVAISNRSSIPAAPSVRRIARELGVNLAEVSGSGILGRINAADVYRMAEGGVAPSPSAAPTAGVGRPVVKLPDFSKWGEIEKSAMSGIRKATARQMDLAWSNIPMVTHHDKADITELEVLRKNYAKRVEMAGGGKLTPTAIIAKVVASALSLPQFKDFNASIDMENLEVIHKHYIHLGIAVDTPRGLIVPVIRDVDKKNVVEISRDLNDIAERGRAAKVKPDEMQGGSFSISNLGGIGGYAFTPIVNHPEVAILGISRANLEPRFNEDGSFEPRLMMGVSLSYDHRLIDGALAARFTRWICEALAEPFVVMLGA